MDRRIEELRHAAPAYINGICTDPSFTVQIMQDPISSNFKLLQFEIYDGTSDLVDHLEVFKTMMPLHGTLDAILSWAFSSTLKGATRNWYSDLRLDMIYSFNQMSH